MYHFTQGRPTKQGHKGIPDGFFEEEQGRDGFFGPVSHLIKSKPSTRWATIEGDLKPRMFDLVKHRLSPGESNLTGRRLLHNADVTLSSLYVDASQKLLARRNADGDWLYFVHSGHGKILTEYGALDYRAGHYLVIPKCVVHNIVALSASHFFLIESRTSRFREPDRGIVGRHVPWDPNALAKPDLDQLYQFMKDQSLDPREILIKHSDATTKMTYDSCIYDVQGWKGDFYPFSLHVDDIMPVLSARVHLPPSAHTTFVAQGFVVCSFLPRPLEEEKDALRVPFYHQNIDYDEILFYHAGDFFSRSNLHAGMMSFHPAGFPHGPHPKAIEKVKNKTHTDEIAVMIDTRCPLIRDEGLRELEIEDYWTSWMKG